MHINDIILNYVFLVLILKLQLFAVPKHIYYCYFFKPIYNTLFDTLIFVIWFEVLYFFIHIFQSMSDNDILDETWIHELQRIQDIKHNYCKENMKSIYIHSIFINNEKHIDKIVKSEITLSQYNHSENIKYIPKEIISNFIKNNKHVHNNNNKSQYKLLDIASFFVTLEPEDIQSYSKTTDVSCTSNFFKFHPSIGDIIVPPSIFIFHSVNSIFLIYQEIIQNTNNHTVKSILKTTSSKIHKHADTKKVRIDTQYNESYHLNRIKHKKTRRNIVIH